VRQGNLDKNTADRLLDENGWLPTHNWDVSNLKTTMTALLSAGLVTGREVPRGTITAAPNHHIIVVYVQSRGWGLSTSFHAATLMADGETWTEKPNYTSPVVVRSDPEPTDDGLGGLSYGEQYVGTYEIDTPPRTAYEAAQ
jgi:hypothetical protein